MHRRKSLLVAPVWMLAIVFALRAQGADPAPPMSADPGEVANATASTPGKINFWVFRSGNEAIAVNIQPVPFSSELKAYLRQYQKGASAYTPKAIELQVDPTAGSAPTVFNNALEVRLVKKQAASGIEYYDLKYVAPTGAEVKVGALRFAGGKNGRNSSDVVVRFNANLKSLVRDPCGEPPGDDMGEEEEIDQSGATLPLLTVATETP